LRTSANLDQPYCRLGPAVRMPSSKFCISFLWLPNLMVVAPVAVAAPVGTLGGMMPLLRALLLRSLAREPPA
jgi:hypothetical protein